MKAVFICDIEDCQYHVDTLKSNLLMLVRKDSDGGINKKHITSGCGYDHRFVFAEFDGKNFIHIRNNTNSGFIETGGYDSVMKLDMSSHFNSTEKLVYRIHHVNHLTTGCFRGVFPKVLVRLFLITMKYLIVIISLILVVIKLWVIISLIILILYTTVQLNQKKSYSTCCSIMIFLTESMNVGL